MRKALPLGKSQVSTLCFCENTTRGQARNDALSTCQKPTKLLQVKGILKNITKAMLFASTQPEP